MHGFILQMILVDPDSIFSMACSAETAIYQKRIVQNFILLVRILGASAQTLECRKWDYLLEGIQ
jgi:hypothetical protein